MSWSITFEGDRDAVGKRFDEERDRAAGYGMIEAEQRDIDEARDFVMTFAEKYGEVVGSASGHWNTSIRSDDAPALKTTFGRVSVTIDKKT